MTMSFATINSQEQKIYTDIGALLNSYDFSCSPEQQQNLFITFEYLHQELLLLETEHTRLMAGVCQKGQQIWVANVNSDVIPTAWKDDPLEYLTAEYHHCVRAVLIFDNLPASDSDHIKSYLLRLMSQPRGQALIIELNKLQRENASAQVTISPGRALTVSAPSKTGHTSVLRSSGVGSSIAYPLEYHQRPATLYPGKNGATLIYSVPFIAFAHELIHCLHVLKNTWKRKELFNAAIQSPLFQLYFNKMFADMEEFSTIEGTFLSENSLREEHNLPPRGGHLSAKAHNDHLQLIKIALLSKMRQEETDFSSMYFPPSFMFPMFLETKHLSLPLTLPQASPFKQKSSRSNQAPLPVSTL